MLQFEMFWNKENVNIKNAKKTDNGQTVNLLE